MILPSTLPILLEQAKLDLKTTECNTAQGSFERSFCDQAKQVDDPVLRCSSMTCLRLDLSCQGNRAWHNYQECYRVVLLCLWFGANMRCGLILHLFDPCWCWGLHDFKSLAKWVSNNFSYIQAERPGFAILRMLVAPCSSNRQANETYTQASATSSKLLDSKSWPHFVWMVLKRQDEDKRSWKIYTKIIQHSKSQRIFCCHWIGYPRRLDLGASHRIECLLKVPWTYTAAY